MQLSQPELERLRAQIRDVVVAVLRKREQSPVAATPIASAASTAPSVKSALVLFTSDQMPADEFFADVSSLVGQGYRLTAALSHTFTQFHGTEVLDRLPKGSGLLPADNEPEQRTAIRNAEAVLAPFISTNTAAKIALGLEDSVSSRLVRAALSAGKPVCVGTDLSAHRQKLQDNLPGATPAIIRIADDHLHTLQQMGVRFTSGNLASCLTEILRPEVNDTPERLARTKAPQKREFVTAEDVWNATSRGQKELVYPRNAVITDQAREYAASRGITLREA